MTGGVCLRKNKTSGTAAPEVCGRGEQCFTLPFWAGLDEVINQYIDSVTLEQLAQSLPAAKDGCCGCNTKT